MSGRRFARWLTAILNRIDHVLVAGHFYGPLFVYQFDPGQFTTSDVCESAGPPAATSR
jgi:hypothetical protein